MSFSIRLDDVSKAKIKSWSLSPRLIHEVLEHLYEELAERPRHHLVRISKPDVRLIYDFTVRVEGDPPRDYLFEFSVRYHSNEATLIIWDCDYLSLEVGLG
jgi:hypothetical protein